MRKAILQWDDGFSVGIQSFDDQHKRLFGVINRVYAALQDRNHPASHERLNGAMNELVDYIKLHFEAEEEAMRAHGYPEYEKHKQEHDDFALTVADFKRRYSEGDAAMTAELLNSLVTWLDMHVNGTDKLYAPYLSARNVR